MGSFESDATEEAQQMLRYVEGQLDGQTK
jgi:hypothetical protein